MAYLAGDRVVSIFSMIARVTHAFNLSFGFSIVGPGNFRIFRIVSITTTAAAR